MSFGNKVSQIFMAIHDFLWHHKFLCAMKVFEVMNSHACVCVLNNLLLIYNNYDYNINNRFEKVDT